jgi:hypothetical protein
MGCKLEYYYWVGVLSAKLDKYYYLDATMPGEALCNLHN